MAYTSSATYLLTKLPHGGLYNHNGSQIELFIRSRLIVDGLTGPRLMSL